ncbi:MAG: hypothetical protein A2511_05340 [Deltaproteobacteria bacterium RIFOXYD12_FULL_50_9]|nr:MAG: hypothetical protein A2511_05340 [Deltaproteobacteria bacterium RIFOXYD12_FULL_50_9]
MAVIRNFLYQLALRLGPFLFRVIARLLFASNRVEQNNISNLTKFDTQGQPFIVAFWHYSIFYILKLKSGRQCVAMVSASKDGEYIARILKVMGLEVVRGSRSKGGLGALKEMVVWLAKGMNAAIVADGSQGPPRQVQAGAILLSSRSGVPIIPIVWSADRYIAFRSWDRLILPKPFARISMWYGEPLLVPAEIKSKDIEQYRLELEKRLNTLYDLAWARFGRTGH